MAIWASMQGISQAPPRSMFAFLGNGEDHPFFMSLPLGCLGTTSHNPSFLLLLFEEFLRSSGFRSFYDITPCHKARE